ncbi:MAG: hypothetical protein V8S08_11900 [Lachnoclostridium sp.]
MFRRKKSGKLTKSLDMISRIEDPKQKKKILTEPAAIKIACDFAAEHECIKIFDAGDVQANGFQIVTDEKQGIPFRIADLPIWDLQFLLHLPLR